VPREHPWGPSVHVDGSAGPAPSANGKLALRLEMQSGDVLELEAEAIDLAEAPAAP